MFSSIIAPASGPSSMPNLRFNDALACANRSAFVPGPFSSRHPIPLELNSIPAFSSTRSTSNFANVRSSASEPAFASRPVFASLASRPASRSAPSLSIAISASTLGCRNRDAISLIVALAATRVSHFLLRRCARTRRRRLGNCVECDAASSPI